MPKLKAEKNPTLIEFAQILKKHRLEAGLSQGALSVKAGLYYNYISTLESGKQNPSYIVLLKIAKALDIHVSEFLKEVDMELVN